MLTLYGNPVSPFVRKVRIHALELGVPFQLEDAGAPGCREALEPAGPWWKVPVAAWDGQVLLDARTMVNVLWERHREAGLRAGLRPPGTELPRFEEENLVTVVDGAMDAALTRFELLKDGVPDAGYVASLGERVQAVLRWAAKRLKGVSFTGRPGLGVPEISLLCALDWLVYRRQEDVGALGVLAAFRAAHRERPSVQDTAPR